MSVFGDQIGGLHVAVGIAGAAVAFALQEVIASIAAWSAVFFGQIYRTGDRIQMAGRKGMSLTLALEGP